jgi:hypothetical protein
LRIAGSVWWLKPIVEQNEEEVKSYRGDTMEPPDRKLLDRVRDALRLKHYSIRTEEAYVNWIERYIYFHNVRHPAEMGEVQSFLTHLAVKENVAASTQNYVFSLLKHTPSARCSSSTAKC